MQISRPVYPPQLQSTPTTVTIAPRPLAGWLAKARRAGTWLMDVDDGGGAIVCFACVLLVFGTLVVRLVQLDHALDSQKLQCTRVGDANSLQMHCEFE